MLARLVRRRNREPTGVRRPPRHRNHLRADAKPGSDVLELPPVPPVSQRPRQYPMTIRGANPSLAGGHLRRCGVPSPRRREPVSERAPRAARRTKRRAASSAPCGADADTRPPRPRLRADAEPEVHETRRRREALYAGGVAALLPAQALKLVLNSAHRLFQLKLVTERSVNFEPGTFRAGNEDYPAQA